MFPDTDVLSVLMAYGARPSPESLIGLSRNLPYKEFRDCCLEAVRSADNPFVPGMTLSVELWNAAEGAGDGEKRRLIDAQTEVDAELLNRFDHLSPTVRGFVGHMAGCSQVFEPERRGLANASKPLELALHGRKQREKFCTVPLVMDFLSRRFTHGLPNLRDTKGVLDDGEELWRLGRGAETGHNLILGKLRERIDKAAVTSDFGKATMAHNETRLSRPLVTETYVHAVILGRRSWLASLTSPGALLQGANARFPGLSILPGAQFYVAGLADRPSSFYRVPAMRMVLDLAAYLGMLAGFVSVVLFLEDGELTRGDFAVLVYVVVSWCSKLSIGKGFQFCPTRLTALKPDCPVLQKAESCGYYVPWLPRYIPESAVRRVAVALAGKGAIQNHQISMPLASSPFESFYMRGGIL